MQWKWIDLCVGHITQRHIALYLNKAWLACLPCWIVSDQIIYTAQYAKSQICLKEPWKPLWCFLRGCLTVSWFVLGSCGYSQPANTSSQCSAYVIYMLQFLLWVCKNIPPVCVFSVLLQLPCHYGSMTLLSFQIHTFFLLHSLVHIFCSSTSILCIISYQNILFIIFKSNRDAVCTKRHLSTAHIPSGPLLIPHLLISFCPTPKQEVKSYCSVGGPRGPQCIQD